MEKRINIRRYSFLKVDIEYYFLFILTLILSIIGLIMISSSSISIGERYFNDPYWFIRRQIIWWVLSFIFFILASKINYRYYRRFSNFIVLISIALLALVFIPGFGIEINGYRRWLDFGFFSVQPSEFVKIALIVLFCDSLDRKYKDNKHIKNIIFPSFLALCVVAVLIFLEPDLGSMVVIGLIVFIVLFVGGVRLKHLFGLGFIGFVVTVVYLFLEDYRRERLFAFINRIIALLNGKGDIGEELGLLGTILVVILFILFMFFGIRVCIKTRDYFGRIMAVGLTSIVIVPAIINISVVIGLLPITGLTLPFVSFGGSSLLFSMVAVGMLLNISRQNALPEKSPELSG